ncbi:MAG: hypothetical protein ABIO44_04730, partial [Saprospiraceae bacterium]
QFPNDPQFNISDSLNSAFQGTPDKMFMRVSLNNPGVYSAGMVVEKDAGEQWWAKTSPTGVDYLSAYVFFDKVNRHIKSLAIGDYRMRIGQGLILDNSFISSSFLDLGFFAKSPEFLKPYHSLQENKMLRGVAMNLDLGQHNTANIFYSKSRIDANLNESNLEVSDPNLIFLSSIQSSGYHRTKSEIEDRNSLGVSYRGITFKHDYANAYLGCGLVNSYQDVVPTSDLAPYQLFLPQIRNQWHGTIFHQLNYKGVLVFGEFAGDQKLNLAAMEGLLKGLGKYADIAIVYRNFSPSFQSSLSQVFSANGKSQNEKGVLIGFNFFINKECRINLSWNSWQHPWLKYRVDLPSHAQEFSARFSFIRKRKWTTYLQYIHRIKEQNTPTDQVNILENLNNESIRLHAEVKINSDWTWRARAEYHGFMDSKNHESGYLIYQDLLFKSIEERTSGNLRFGFYQTDSYNTRIYTFENDMLYQFRIPAYFGTGAIGYLNIRTRINNSLSAEARFSIQYSGYKNQLPIHENSYNKEIKLQIHYSFN